MDTDARPIFSHVRAEPLPGRIDLDWTVEDDDPGFSAMLHYRMDGGSWTQLSKDLPTETDPVSGAWSFRDTLWLSADTTQVEVYFSVSDQGGQENRFPDTTLVFSYPGQVGPLYINEFSASNSNIKQDEWGEYDDWAEVYNGSGEAVWLADYYLSDNNGSPGKYRFPETFIQAGSFYLVWLDDQEEQGVNHATFKISKEGERLRLSEGPSTGYRIVDSISFGLQETDISFGRLVDGGPQWILFPSPTPNYSNLSTALEELPDPHLTLSLYPNPVSGGIIYFNRKVSGTIYNLMGQALQQVEDAEQAEIPLLEKGFYIFRSRKGELIEFVVTR
jgi:hypothetical protein